MLAINSVVHDSAMAGCLGGRQRLAGAKPLDGHLPTKASQRLAGCRQRLTEKGSTRPGRGVAVREPRANAAADLLSQGPAAAAAAGGRRRVVCRPSSVVIVVVCCRASRVVCRLSSSVVVRRRRLCCRILSSVACRLFFIEDNDNDGQTLTMMIILTTR